MVESKSVAVIGGGVSGLAAAKAFSERGHRVVGFERASDFGGVWESSRSYPGIQTQSPKDLYCFSDFPMPDDYPEWPTGPQVLAYLKAYASKHDLEPLFRLGTTIRLMERRTDGQAGWTLTVERDGATEQADFDFVVVCTGQFSDKLTPTIPGQADFVEQGGAVLHSSEYTDPARVKGQRVVVLGGSKSATDIAVNAASSGAASVHLVYRRNVWRVPYFVGGINFKNLLYMRLQEMQFNGWNRRGLDALLFALMKPLYWANFRGLELMLTLQLGLRKWGMVPETPIEHEASCALPIVTPGMFEAFRKGSVVPVKGTIESCDGSAVVLSTGDRIAADVVILATGWKLGVPYLGEAHQQHLVASDGLYRTYRLAVNPDLPGLGFVGFNSSFCTVLSSELIANWLVRFMDGQLAQQPSEQEMRDTMEQMLRWRREERPAAQVYGGQCVAPFHFRHFDQLLDDMGCRERGQRNPLVEYLSYPRAEAYGRYLASALQYRAS